MKASFSPILLVVIVAAGTGVAAAQEETPSYSIEDVTACSADAMRFCRHNMPSIKAIEDCMRANYDKLKPKCQARFKDR